ncbi:MAG TPA: hypothetical protein VF517_17805 [Thermoleophilaceae bacterium]|jgi:hypothetical protein
MTRKVTLAAFALALVLALVPAGGAAAAPQGEQISSASAFPPLTEASARRLALKLARSVAHKRNVRSWQLSEALSVRPNRVVFGYADRNRKEVFCTARLVVERSATRRRAFISAPECAGIPGEALEIERATSAVVRAVAGQRPDARLSVRRYEKDLRDCEGLVVPRGRHAEVELLYDAGATLASVDPLLTHLDAFVTRLQDIQPEDTELASGVVWWRRLITSLGSLPRTTLRPCTAILEWANDNYSTDTAPVDFAELQRTLDTLKRENRGILRAAEHLAELGVAPRLSAGFTPDVLIATALGR